MAKQVYIEETPEGGLFVGWSTDCKHPTEALIMLQVALGVVEQHIQEHSRVKSNIVKPPFIIPKAPVQGGN